MPDDHVVAFEVAGILTELRKDFLGRDRAGHIPRRVEQHTADCRLHFRRLLIGFADDDPRREDRPVAAVQHELRAGGVDPDPVSRHGAGQPAPTLQIDRNLPRPGLIQCRARRRGAPRLMLSRCATLRRGDLSRRACGGALVVLQGAAQCLIFRRIRGQRLDRRRRVGARNGAVECRRDIDRLGFQILVVHPLLDRQHAARQSVGIGKKGVGQQQIAVDRRQGGRIPQRGRMEQLGIEPVFAGPQYRLQQRFGLRLAGIPHRLVSMRRIEPAQQPDMQVLAGYRQPGTVEPHLDLGVGNSGRRRRHTRIGRQRHRHQWTPAIVRRLSVSAVRHGQGECRGDSYAARPAAAPAGAIRHDYFGCEHDALARRVIGA